MPIITTSANMPVVAAIITNGGGYPSGMKNGKHT